MSVSRIESQGVPPEPWLITADELARMMNVSTRTLWRLRSAGQLPQPVRLGGTVRWRLAEIHAWIAEGCPTASALKDDRRQTARPWYHVCPRCNAKSFQPAAHGACPRCGHRSASNERLTPPWQSEPASDHAKRGPRDDLD